MTNSLDPTTPQSIQTLYGLERDLAVVVGRLETALKGRLQVVLMVGEPGIGKTRLLNEVASRALTRGWL